MKRNHLAEVWLMWRNKHNFRLNTLLTIGIWLDIFGVIALAIASFYDETNRLLFISLIFVLVILLVISFFSAAGDVYKRDTTKLSLINDQKSNISLYLQSRFLHLYLRNDRQVDVEIEWFNQTLFGLSFESAHDGIAKINDLECKVTSNDKRSCSASSVCSYIITLLDKDIIELVRDSISKTKPVKLFLVFSLGGVVYYEWDRKPESSRPFDVQCHIDVIVTPQKI